MIKIKSIKIMLVLLASVCVIANASITEISLEIMQDLDVTAAYDHTTGIATWSGGGTGWAVDPCVPGLLGFSSVTVSAAFSDVTDQSPGTGLAKAIFSTGGFTITASGIVSSSLGALNGTITMKAELRGGDLYRETEKSADVIDGRAVIKVTEFTYTGTDYTVEWADDVSDPLEKSGVIADITLNQGTAFGDYDTDSYLTNNAIITVFADETLIPEPATMGLLGLGCIIFARRRRNA